MNSVLSAVRRCFQPAGRGGAFRSPYGSTGHPQHSVLIPVLLASVRHDDYETFRDLTRGTKWCFVRAFSCSDIESFCACMLNPIILVDRHFQGSNWRLTISSLLCPATNRCLILLRTYLTRTYGMR